MSYFALLGWHLRGYVFRNPPNIDSSLAHILNFDYRVWFGILHRVFQIEGKYALREGGRRTLFPFLHLPRTQIETILVHLMNLSYLDGCNESISIFDDSDVVGANIFVSIFIHSNVHQNIESKFIFIKHQNDAWRDGLCWYLCRTVLQS